MKDILVHLSHGQPFDMHVMETDNTFCVITN